MSVTPKKICIVGISLGKGGAERAMALQTTVLHNLGYKVHSVILTDEIDYHYKGELLNLGKLKTEKDSFFKRFYRLRKLRKYIKKHRFDFVIDHRPKNNYKREVFYHRYIYGNVRKIYIAHTSKEENVLTEKPNKFKKLLNQNFANIAVSKYIENTILLKNGIQKTTTIYNPFDQQWSNESITIPEEINNKNYLLSYGRLVDSVKDFSFLIRAFNQSNLWKQDTYLVIMGEGKDKERLQALAKSTNANKHILFLAFYKNPFHIVKQSKLVTLTSYYEGLPMVLVESLSVGTPVISLDIPSGPSEIIQHKKNGLLIKKRSEKHFAEAMQMMINDKKLYQTCKENAKTSVEKFSMENSATEWKCLIEKSISSNTEKYRV